MKTPYQPVSTLLLAKKNFELRFTPHLTQIFVKNTDNGEITFPVKPFRMPGSTLVGAGGHGKQTVRGGVIYPYFESRNPGVTNWKKIPVSLHRQVLRILGLKKVARQKWEATIWEIREELQAV